MRSSFFAQLAWVLILLLTTHCQAQPTQPSAGKKSASATSDPVSQSNAIVPQPDTTTDRELRNYNTLVEMLLGAQLNHKLRAELRQFVDQYRFSSDPERRKPFQNSLLLYQQLMSLPAGEREAQTRQLRSVVFLEQWKLAKTGDAEARWYLDVYCRIHPPLASGEPALTKDVVDALLEFDYFFNVEVKGIKAPPIDEAFRQKMYQETAAKWKTLDEAGRQEILQSAAQVSTYRVQWSHSNAEQRLMIRARAVGVQNLTPQEQQYIAQMQQMQGQMNQMLSNHQFQMMNNQLQYMRQNQQTIMGNGTYYNQTLGRWEQHGGIVTEYH